MQPSLWNRSDIAQRLHQHLQLQRELQSKAFARLQTLLSSPAAAVADVDCAQQAWEASKTAKWAAFDSFEAALKELDPSFLTRAERRFRRRHYEQEGRPF